MDVRIGNRALALLAFCLTAAYLWPFHPHPFGGFISDWLALLGVVLVGAFHLFAPIDPERIRLEPDPLTPPLSQRERVRMGRDEIKTSSCRINSIQLRVPWLAAVPLGLALLILIQTLAGMLLVPWDAVLPIAYLCMAAVAMVLGASLAADQKGGAQRLCAALAGAHLLAGLVSVVIAAVQFMRAEAAFGGWIINQSAVGVFRPFANIAQPNQLALLFCMAIAALWWLYQTVRVPVSVGRLLAALVWPLLLGLALTQSRIGWLIVPAFALLLLYWNRQGGVKAIPASLIALGVLVYGALVLSLPALAGMMGVLAETVAQRTGGSSVRWSLIQQAWQISLLHPWLGAGWYQFGPQQVALGAIYPDNMYAEHAHNLIANFIAEVGWPSTLATVGALGYWLVAACLRRPLSKEAGFATLVFVAVLAHSMTEYPLWYAYVLMPVAMLMGMLHQQRFGARVVELPSLPLAGLVALIAVGLIGTAADFRRLNLGFQALGFESMQLRPLAGSSARPAFTLFPYYYDYFQFAKAPVSAGMPAEEVDLLERAAQRFPYAIVLEKMAAIDVLNGRQDAALRAMLVLYALHPDTYKNNYFRWQYLASTRPDLYAGVFFQLPLPSPVRLQ